MSKNSEQDRVSRAHLSRRTFLAASGATTATVAFNLFGGWGAAMAEPLAAGLVDPVNQRLFREIAPNALSSDFRFEPSRQRGIDRYRIAARATWHRSGVRNGAGRRVRTRVYGYGDALGTSWPARTIHAEKGRPVSVRWVNALPSGDHLLPLDDSYHWAYGIPGYEGRTIAQDGVPMVAHLHGGHVESGADGYPEAFFSPRFGVRGPEWPGRDYLYANDQDAGTLWYHDHTLGMTRLNVYAGLAGFYILRDDVDTGKQNNPLGLPAGDHELGYVIQDRMFRDDGSLFYPAYPGDPAWSDFITDQGLADDQVPQPSGLAEFFGDIITVNGKVWPRADVAPRHYRIRLLNGSDSRFYALQLRVANRRNSTTLDGAGAPLPFWVIGSDQGLGTPRQMDHLLLSPGERMDIVVDFTDHVGQRLILSNTAGDAPFGGDLVAAAEDLFPNRHTDRIMAFDVNDDRGARAGDRFDPSNLGSYGGVGGPVTKVRKLALFEGMDEYGRLQPMLGLAEPGPDETGAVQDGTLQWHKPITELPGLGTTEEWHIYNATEDAHPIHLHQVNFEILGRSHFTADVVEQAITQHNGTTGTGFRLANIVDGGAVAPPAGFYEPAPKDMVTALPEQVTRIRMHWDLPGLYVWHCHILSHEDHDMMRPLRVV